MYLSTITRGGKTLLIETDNIKSIQLLQPVGITGKSGTFYLVLIIYDDDSREQTVISEESWKWWNSDERK